MPKIVRGEIVLPQTKPETEWLRGRAVRKMSPRWTHAALQKWWLARLDAWASERGYVGAEWRFRIALPGEEIRPLVPDVAYLAYDRIGDASDEDLEAPRVAPNVAVEIRSPGDDRRDLEAKVSALLRAGTEVVIVVNPRTRTVVAWDAYAKRIFSGDETFAHDALPDLRFALAEMFAAPRIRRPR